MKQRYYHAAVLLRVLTAGALAQLAAVQALAKPANQVPTNVVQANPASSLPNPASSALTSAPPAVACTNCVLALTPVELVIDADLGSKISTTGAMFPLHLNRPILIDGREVVPVGAEGQGEVIHAKKAGGSGSAGELVLAARFITVGDRQLKLRSMRIAVAGRDAIHTIDAINAASVASPLPVGLLGFVITGRNVAIPKGSVAIAKTAEAFVLEPPVAVSAVPDQAQVLPTQPQAAQ